MSTNIILKRSSVPGKVPTTGQLDLGEIAINTNDGKLYFKKYDSVANTESVVTLLEVTEDNLLVDTNTYSYSTANTLSEVLKDLDDAIATISAGGLTSVTSDSTLNGAGTVASPLSVANNGHVHTIANVTGLQGALDDQTALTIALS